jgi:hypothetical protein
MHAEALSYIAAHIPTGVASVLEFGSRNINGTVRDLVPTVDRYVGVDLVAGPGVDHVCDAGSVEVPGLFELVVCAEVFEHATDKACMAMCANAWRHLKDGGTFVATMAGPGRMAHSAVDGGMVRPGEYYRNVLPETLGRWLEAAGFSEYTIDQARTDMRCTAVK